MVGDEVLEEILSKSMFSPVLAFETARGKFKEFWGFPDTNFFDSACIIRALKHAVLISGLKPAQPLTTNPTIHDKPIYPIYPISPLSPIHPIPFHHRRDAMHCVSTMMKRFTAIDVHHVHCRNH